MAAFISPAADDPVTKIQNLLQNTLYSFADITVSYAPEKYKELESKFSEAGISLKPPTEDANPETPDAVSATEPGVPAPGSVMDRVERLGQLNDHIQATVDELPDTTIQKDEILSQVKLLNEECQRASEELKELYTEFDSAFRMLRENMSRVGS